MSIEEFKEYVKGRCPLDTEEIHRFMDEMSDRARRVTFRLNTAYHTPDEVRGLLSELFGYEGTGVAPSLSAVLYRFRREHYCRRGCFSSMPAAIFRTTAAASSGTAAKSDTMWCSPRSTTIAARNAQAYLSRPYRSREKCLDRFQRDRSAGGDHWRQCRRRGGCGRDEGRGREYGRGRSAGEVYQIHLKTEKDE